MSERNEIWALVAEDDPSWQDIFREILEDRGVHVDVVDNREAAKASLRAKTHRLAIVDLSLGGADHKNQDGLHVLKAVRQHDPNCAAVLVTGFATVELAVRAINNLGAMTCLRKEEFSRSAFVEILDQALTFADIEASTALETTASNQFTQTHAMSGASEMVGQALLVEDDAGWRSLMAELLLNAGYEAKQSSSYVEAIGALKQNRFQLAVIDLSLASSVEPQANMDGYRLLARTQTLGIPTIVVSGYAEPAKIEQAYEEHQIYACIEKQSFDRSAFIRTATQAGNKQSNRDALNELTNRERQVLELLVSGKTNKGIAEELYVTPNTIKQHLKSIFNKLDVSSRAAAVAKALRT